MKLENLVEFKASPEIREKLALYGIAKTFSEGDVILRENAYINSIPIVTSGSIRVLTTDDYGRGIMSFLGGLHQDTSKIKAGKLSATKLGYLTKEELIQQVKL